MAKPSGKSCVNVSPGKTSYVLAKHNVNFNPVAVDPTNPQLGDIFDAKCKDKTNSFYFNASVVGQVDKKRLAIKVLSGLPLGGGDPTDGILTITLLIFTGTPLPDTQDLDDVPVEYITDPNGP